MTAIQRFPSGIPSSVPAIVGVDGCSGGWIAVSRTTCDGVITSDVYGTFECLLARMPAGAVIAVDMPIGLSSDARPRDCDALARHTLGPSRGASVFGAPNRQVLGAKDYAAACKANRQGTRGPQDEGRAISLQAFHLLRKIEEVDAAVRARGPAASGVFEVHPELSFMALRQAYWNADGGDPPQGGLAEPKRTLQGRLLRRQWLAHAFGADVQTVLAQRAGRYAGLAKPDDVLDALAASWSAWRIATGQCVRLPETPRYDTYGVPMVIHF